MKRVDTIARVRRAFYVHGWSVKKIVRELHVSRNTVRKILRSDETDFSYERSRQPLPRIGPWQGQLEQFLSSNASKSSRERLTLIRIFEELQALGYEGGYDAVRRFARTWSQSRGAVTAEAYVPLYYAPGEAYQFDWSHEVVLISGVPASLDEARPFMILGIMCLFWRANLERCAMAPFRDWALPAAMSTIRRKLKGSDDGDRQMVQILACVPEDGLQAVEAACREALDHGVHSAPVVINTYLMRAKRTQAMSFHTPSAHS